MTENYRAWGQLSWLTGRLPVKNWSLLGTLGTEDRCTAAHKQIRNKVVNKLFLQILDPHMSNNGLFLQRYEEIKCRLLAQGVVENEIKTVDLLQDTDTIEDVVKRYMSSSSGQIILDISSMPKRWFFPVLRFLLKSDNVENLVVTYTVAASYGKQLSSDLLSIGPLPTFDKPRDSKHYDDLVVGVGFAPLGLKDLFESEFEKIRYLFPFPPGPPNYYRNWNFLRSLENEMENRNLKTIDRWQVHTYDLPNTFDALCRVTQNGCRTSAMAPFGPKTQSLAMCLFALAAEDVDQAPVHIYYTQPRRYAIDYSNGVAEIDNKPDIKAYCIKVNGRKLYTI